MYSFEFDTIHQLTDATDLEKGCYLCIWHAHKIPPHIGIMLDGLYFSLKVKGKDTAIPVEEILKLIHRKTISTVFTEIRVDVNMEEIKTVFAIYSKAESNKNSCLTPINEVFGLRDEVQILADLLNYFKAKQQIGKIFGLHLIPGFKGIPTYGKEEIEARLKLLSKV